MTALAAPAKACIVSDGFIGILFHDIPADVAENDVILDVDFSWQAVRVGRYPNAVVTAHVQRVVRGEFHGDTVRVGLGNSSCDYPFIFGRRGLLIGHFVAPDEGQRLTDQWNPPLAFGGETLRLSWPFESTVFVPRSESIATRRARTGAALWSMY